MAHTQHMARVDHQRCTGLLAGGSGQLDARVAPDSRRVGAAMPQLLQSLVQLQGCLGGSGCPIETFPSACRLVGGCFVA